MKKRNMILLSVVGTLFLLLIGFWVWSGATDASPSLQNSSEVGQAAQLTAEPNELEELPDSRNAVGKKQKAEPKPEILITGTVSLASTGEPVHNAKVTILKNRNYSDVDPVSVLTSEDGRFHVSGVFERGLRVVARKDNLISFSKRAEVKWMRVSPDTISLGPIHLKLYPSETLGIKVVSELDGKPLANATAETLQPPQQFYKGNRLGRIAIPLTSEAWSLFVKAPGHEMKKAHFDLSGGFEGDFEVVLAPAGEFHGHVMTVDGDPVAGASVTMRMGYLRVGTTSDENGAYLLDHIPLRKKVYIWARKPAVGDYSARHSLKEGPSEKLDLVLKQANRAAKQPRHITAIEGRVTDSEDQPIEGALIVHQGNYAKEEKIEVRSDVDGRFQLTVKSGPRLRNVIEVTKPGYAGQRVPFLPDSTVTAEVKVILKEGHYLRGRVLGSKDEPIADALMLPKEPRSKYSGSKIQPAITDVSGYFELEDLPASVLLKIKAEGFSPLETEELELNRDDVVFTLQNLGQVNGRVVFEETGEPVTSYRIFLKGKASTFSYSNYSSEHIYEDGVWVQTKDGSFQISDLEVGTPFFLSASSEGYHQQELHSITVAPPGEASPVLLKLVPNQERYAGVVLDSSGNNLSGVQVSFYGWPATKHASYRSAMYLDEHLGAVGATFEASQITTAAGFVFDSVPSNMSIACQIELEGYSKDEFYNLEGKPESERQALKFSIQRVGQLNVLIAEDPLPEGAMLDIKSDSHYYDSMNLDNRQKEIQVVDLAPGKYTLELKIKEPQTLNHVIAAKATSELAEGESKQVVIGGKRQYRLEGIALVGTEIVSGRKLGVFTPNDSPILYSNNRIQKSVITGPDGHFLFEDLMPGRYGLTLVSRQPTDMALINRMHHTEPKNVVWVEIDDEDIFDQFRFKKMSSVKGTFVNGAGVSSLLLANNPVVVQRSNLQTVIQADGRFHFLDVPAGIYSLHAKEGQASKTRLIMREITVPENGTDVDLGEVDAEKTGQLKVSFAQVHDKIRETGFHFFIHSQSDRLTEQSFNSLFRHSYTDFAQPYYVDGIAEGSYKLGGSLGFQGWITQPMYPSFDIRGGETTEVTLDLIAVTQILVRVPPEAVVTGASMVHSETQQQVVFNGIAADPMHHLLGQAQFALIYKNTVYGRGFREGRWQLRVTGENGQFVEHEFEAVPGNGGHIYLEFP